MAQQLTAAARVLTLGSCFADSIGARLAADKVNVLVNPFGTVFQPLAAGRLLRAALGEDIDWQQHLVEARGRWQSYDLHGSQGAATPVELLQDIQQTVRRTGEFLRGADILVLTLGTAWTYRLRETGELVNNCHKMPAELFERELLTPDDIINGLAETHAYLRRSNPKLRIILTVSPVRHLRDTLPLNAVSKSVLRVACHYLSELLPDVSYFPAYELLTDDLRDYRFYTADMLHPSEVAVDYVWEKFARTYFDADFGRLRKEWAGLRQALNHRPLNAAAPEHRQFLENTRERLERLSRQRVNVAAELREVEERLATLPVPAAVMPVESEHDGEERVDIGSFTAVEAPALPLYEATETSITDAERAPRLSPEEFRAQRAARNNRPERGRRGDRNANPATAQPAPAEALVTPATDLVATTEDLAKELTTVLPATDDFEADPAKKKKRRSRGGAKRTARKNAAKLAASNEGEAPSESELVVATGGQAEETPVDSPPDSQPEARKSSVITKSVPVKRGGRDRNRSEESNSQFNTATPAEATIVEAPTPAATEQSAIAPRQDAGESTAADAADPEYTLQATDQPANRRNQGPKVRPLFAAATPALATDSVAAADPAATAPAKPSAQKQARRRPAPAIETPPMVSIVPIRTDLRTGVAAGRMRGSDAMLVAVVPAKKVVVPKVAIPKAVAPKIPAAKGVAPKAASSPTPKAARPQASTQEIAASVAAAPKASVPKVAASRRKTAATGALVSSEPIPVVKRTAKPRAKKTANPPDLPESADSPA